MVLKRTPDDAFDWYSPLKNRANMAAYLMGFFITELFCRACSCIGNINLSHLHVKLHGVP